MSETTRAGLRRVALFAAGMIYGMAAHRFQWPPYGLLKGVQSGLQALAPSAPPTPRLRESAEPSAELLETDVAQLISLHEPRDATRLRAALITLLWGKPGLPSALPVTIERDVAHGLYGDLPALAAIDRFDVRMDFGLVSRVHQLHPIAPNGQIVLHHEGHASEATGRPVVARLLASGYRVLTLAMPLYSPNNRPRVWLPRIGPLALTHHDQLKLLVPASGHPLKYFLEPVVVTLNYVEKTSAQATVSMMGLSGGGWTTTLAAAIDTRIRKSFPVAGSYPLHLLSSQREWGDYEQTVPEVYRLASYPELYVLGSLGNGRKQVQVLNQADPCCFAGTRWKTYLQPVRSRVRLLGDGGFDVFMDPTHREHSVSSAALNRILFELRNRGATAPE